MTAASNSYLSSLNCSFRCCVCDASPNLLPTDLKSSVYRGALRGPQARPDILDPLNRQHNEDAARFLRPIPPCSILLLIICEFELPEHCRRWQEVRLEQAWWTSLRIQLCRFSGLRQYYIYTRHLQTSKRDSMSVGHQWFVGYFLVSMRGSNNASCVMKAI